MGTFNVLNMAQDYAQNNDIDIEDIFAKPEKPEEKPIEKDNDDIIQVRRVEEKHPNVNKEINENSEIPTKQSKERKPWVPDADLIEDMPEIQNKPVVYDKSEVQFTEDHTLKNNADEALKQEAFEKMDELQRKYENIEEAKKRHGIEHFKIPLDPLVKLPP